MTKTREGRRAANRRMWLKHSEKIKKRRRELYAEKRARGWDWTPEQKEKRRAHVRRWMDKHQREWKQRRLEKISGRPRPETCEVCSRRNKRIVFDHCHKTGGFRGWLCHSCNTILGHANDDPEILRKLIGYLTAP